MMLVSSYNSNYRTLARWHRKLAKHRLYFCATPAEVKTPIPTFFHDNPDALEAFKRYGVAHIQDLRVELIHNYVHQDLIPKLLLKAEHKGLFDDDGNDINNEEVEITPTIARSLPKDLFLQMLDFER